MSFYFYDEKGNIKKNADGVPYYNFKAMFEYEPKVKVIVTEKNRPNLDKMAKAFYELLRK